jgi:hypothetical protein
MVALCIPVPLHIIFPARIIAEGALVLLFGIPTPPGFVGMPCPKMSVEVLVLGAPHPANVASSTLGMVVLVFALHGR